MSQIDENRRNQCNSNLSRSLNIHNWVYLWAMAVQNYSHLFILENGTKWTEQEGKEDPKILKRK